MRSLAIIFLMVGMLTIGSCARPQDDPANPPRLGQWQDRTVLTGVRLNDRALREEEIPPELRRIFDSFAKEDHYCGEPHPRDRAEMQALLNDKFRSCEIQKLGAERASIDVLARCRPRGERDDVLITARGSGTFGSNYVRFDIEAIARLTEKTGGNYLLVASGRREITRTGDC